MGGGVGGSEKRRKFLRADGRVQLGRVRFIGSEGGEQVGLPPSRPVVNRARTGLSTPPARRTRPPPRTRKMDAPTGVPACR